MKNLIALAGLDDGQGNTSSMRVFLMLIGLAVVLPKLILFFKTWELPVWTAGDMEMLGIALSGKVIQNQQENAPPKTL